ncbi:MAG: hypothetical protein JNG90_10560 [Planctomycetaceae bacterium]|nr:hypothetical protein [Planctomycetaceae bacterium]
MLVDRYLLERLTGAELKLHPPHDAGPALAFDKPWEGLFCGYATVIYDEADRAATKYRLYYRGMPSAGHDGSDGEVTCYAESTDGVRWTKPELGLYEVASSKQNNVVLAGLAPYSHNFSPLWDTRPNVPADERYKALAGTRQTGLVAFASADGLRWRKLRDEPVITDGAFDSQNVAFWSPAEQSYVAYFRTFADGVRRISRTTSPDFRNWGAPVLMQYRHGAQPGPVEHLYTNQTHPYFRAPQLYVATAARFLPGRQVLTAAEAAAIDVHPRYFQDTSDAVLLTTRGGDHYEREFLGAFIRPGIGARNWVSRTNYPALGIVPTSPTEMSVYVQHDYGQPTAHLQRYTLRLDGFASLTAGVDGGEALTRPLTFTGRRLLLNFATSAAGSIRVEIQSPSGEPLPGYALADAPELIGNEIERTYRWKNGEEVAALAGQPVRLRFVLQDADLFAFRFE